MNNTPCRQNNQILSLFQEAALASWLAKASKQVPYIKGQRNRSIMQCF